MQTHLQDQLRTSLTKDLTLKPQLQPNTEMSHAISLQPHSQNVSDFKSAPLRPVISHGHMPKHQPAQNGSSVYNTMDQDGICGIMQRQNEITSMLVQQQLLTTLPQREIITFDSDPLQFVSFMRTFEHCVEERTSSYQDCLYFLEQYTRGQPKEAND